MASPLVTLTLKNGDRVDVNALSIDYIQEDTLTESRVGVGHMQGSVQGDVATVRLAVDAAIAAYAQLVDLGGTGLTEPLTVEIPTGVSIDGTVSVDPTLRE